jgi:hypothetical protein
MKVTHLDEPFRLFGATDASGVENQASDVPPVMWMESPISEEQVDKATEIRQQMMDALATCTDGEAAEWIGKIERLPLLKESPGKAFTTRNAILASLFANDFPMRGEDHQESPEDKALVASLVIKVHNAKDSLDLEQREVETIKRYTYECDQAMPVMAHLFNALDSD